MKKMQWCSLKNIIIILITLACSPFSSFSQISNYRLNQADSLFQAKQYTQSLEHYRTILEQKQYSPAMLLKMAYIQEGLNNVGEALYYLNLYYLSTKDPAVLDKMEELSSKYNLEGYKNTDASRAFTIYYDYHLFVSIILAALIFFLLSLSIYIGRKKIKPVASIVVLLFLVIMLAVHINAGEESSMAIISQPNAYLMDGPSAGASVVSVLTSGHRIEINGREDVWMKIKWKGRTAYIREHNVLPIAL